MRAARIYKIVEEVVDAGAWRHGSQPYETERDSLVTLLAAADDHSTRMMPSRNNCGHVSHRHDRQQMSVGRCFRE